MCERDTLIVFVLQTRVKNIVQLLSASFSIIHNQFHCFCSYVLSTDRASLYPCLGLRKVAKLCFTMTEFEEISYTSHSR